jgi:hypothetical protein
MHRRRFAIFVLSICGSFFTVVRRVVAWDLITKKELEYENSQPRPKEILPEAEPGAPTIEVDQPDVSKPIHVPVSVRLRFRPQSGAAIDPHSFRAKYGWLGIDITDRIVANAEIDASGLTADNAEIPPGQYSVTLQISDNFRRVGTRVIDFTVT